jgi:hypothetical protein
MKLADLGSVTTSGVASRGVTASANSERLAAASNQSLVGLETDQSEERDKMQDLRT